MESSLEEPLSLERIAEVVEISRRQLERLFETYLRTSPHKYYVKLRLDRGRQLLEATNKPIIEIAIACGFVSASHISKRYRLQHRRSPQKNKVRTLARCRRQKMRARTLRR